ncbi:MAG: DNA polymerase III subunit gamma/tau [Desulfobacteraceae bacterium]|nr:MAG: DNA polymerase III subunit gamma/tau [Desulfobacteraceae bacterium]
MSYLVFARKYRPQNFDEVVQQEHVTRTLKNAISAGRVPHALLFTGPRGTGKTTVARIFAKAMNCAQGPTPTPCNACRSCDEITNGHAADVFEIDGASNNSVDQVRELRENLKYMPAHSRHKIYIIDEVHMLSLAAFNALLKTLEEPPAHVLFVFATTDPHKIPVTILSRCQRHDLRRIDLSAISDQMRRICDQESVVIDDAGLTMIAREAGGSMRDALSLLDHVFACAEGPIKTDLIAELLGSAERRQLFELSAAVFARDIAQVLAMIDTVWRRGLEMKRFYCDLLSHFQSMAIIKLGDKAVRLVDLPAHEIKQMQSQVRDVSDGFLTQALDLLFQIEPSIKWSAQPKLALEMVFLKLFQSPPALSVENLIKGLDQLRSVAHPAERTSSQEMGPRESPPSSQEQEDQSLSRQTAPTEPARADARPSCVAAPLGAPLWDCVVRHVIADKPPLGAFLNKCRASFPEETRLELEVCGNDFTFKNVQKNADYLEKICADLSGKPIKIVLTANCEDTGGKRKEKMKTERLKQKALTDPLVMEAVELFRGKVVDIKVI